MGRKNRERRAELRYEFDRLLREKMEQAYDILFSKVLKDLEQNGRALAVSEKKRGGIK